VMFAVSSPLAGYDYGMASRYGITLDETSIRWAAAEGVSETIIAAVLLLHEKSVDEVAAKLRPGELAHVVRFVSRCPTCYPPGTLAALRSLTPTPQPSRTSVSTDQLPSRLAARSSAENLYRYRPNARKRAGHPFEHPRSATAAAKPTDTQDTPSPVLEHLALPAI
jgi:hypothetical protein